MLSPIVALLSWMLLSSLALAQNNTDLPGIFNDSKKYAYFGCYNETTDLPGTTDDRALADGINEVRPGNMTVPLCLEFCSSNGTQYRFAGLEFSRECWCSQMLSGLSKKLDDGMCNLPCAGNTSLACGGALKLSVYEISHAPARLGVSALFLGCGILIALFLQ